MIKIQEKNNFLLSFLSNKKYICLIHNRYSKMDGTHLKVASTNQPSIKKNKNDLNLLYYII